MLLFIAIAIAEIYVLLGVGEVIGVGWTIFLIILTGAVGVNLLKRQGFSVFNRFQQKMATGQAPAQEMVEGLLLVVAGAFLITPGFVTDTLGFLWLIPISREFFAKGLIKAGWFKMASFNGQGQQNSNQQEPFQQQGAQQSNPSPASSKSEPTIIEGEFERKD